MNSVGWITIAEVSQDLDHFNNGYRDGNSTFRTIMESPNVMM
jgi:hypothetical protein